MGKTPPGEKIGSRFDNSFVNLHLGSASRPDTQRLLGSPKTWRCNRIYTLNT